MGHVAFGAFGPVMIFDDDLFEPSRTSQVDLMATDAMAAGGLDRQDVRIVGVIPAHAVAALAGEGLVRILGQLVQDLGVTFIARLFAGKHGGA